MKLFFMMICSLCMYQAWSQKTSSPTDTKEKSIKFPKFPIADIPKKTYPLSTIKIVQFVTDSLHLGYIQKGMDNHTVFITPSGTLTECLQENVNKMYDHDYKKEGTEMLWVVKELRIGERSGFREYAYLRFNGDSYILSVSDGKYHPAFSIDTVFFSESMGDVTPFHGGRIEETFKIMLTESLKNATGKMNDANGVSMETIAAAAKTLPDLPILSAETYNDGGYATFEEFAQNKPSVLNPEAIVDDHKKTTFFKVSADGKKDTVQLWGIAKGGELYKYFEGHPVPIERNGKSFVISGYVEKHDRRNKGIFIGGLIAGVPGILAAGGANYKISYPVTSVAHITNRKKQPEACIIDLKTGEFAF